AFKAGQALAKEEQVLKDIEKVLWMNGNWDL
ncbi:MAG: hypothetical protein PWQ68_2458, partial [Thermoanaerobacteraceae bacterium]|nr:hypothetical protein [Thermoanaerobacteraceae bacterium]